MTSKKWIWVLVVAVAAGFVIWNRSGTKPAAPVTVSGAGAQVAQQTPGAGPAADRGNELREIFKLAVDAKPEALERIRRALESGDATHASVAVRALGYYGTDEAMKLIRTAWASPQATVRHAAAGALGMKPFLAKRALALEFLSAARTEEEKAHLKVALLWQNPSDAEKRKTLEELSAIALKVDTSPEMRRFLAPHLLRFGKGSKMVERYLQANLKNASKLDEATLMGVLQGMKQFCPPQALTALESALARTDLSAAARGQLVMELPFYSVAKARPVLERIKAKKQAAPESIQKVEAVLGKAKPVCER